MVPVSTGNMGSLQDLGVANPANRPNSAAGNPGMTSLPNGMIADPSLLGNPTMNTGLPNGTMGGPMINGGLGPQGPANGQMGGNGLSNNGPMEQQNFANGGMGNLQMGSMPMANMAQPGKAVPFVTLNLTNDSRFGAGGGKCSCKEIEGDLYDNLAFSLSACLRRAFDFLRYLAVYVAFLT